MALIQRLLSDEDGADAMEYALVGTLIVVALIAGATAFSSSVNHLFDFVSTRVDASIPSI